MSLKGNIGNISEAEAQKLQAEDVTIFRDSSSPEGEGVYKAKLTSGEVETIGGSSAGLLTFCVTLTPAQIKAIKVAPQDLVKAPGAGKYIDFIDGSYITGDGAAYKEVKDLTIFNPSVKDFPVGALSNVLVNKNTIGKIEENASINPKYKANEALQIGSTSNTPTTGDYDVIIKGVYRILSTEG